MALQYVGNANSYAQTNRISSYTVNEPTQESGENNPKVKYIELKNSQIFIELSVIQSEGQNGPIKY